MRGFNVILGSHYDHYYLIYDQFDNSPIDPSVFKIESGLLYLFLWYQKTKPILILLDLTCSGFPGPGDRHIATFNPMAEFIRPETTSHVDFEFNKFIQKHRKSYDFPHETHLRREVFRQNLRYIHSHNRKNVGKLECEILFYKVIDYGTYY